MSASTAPSGSGGTKGTVAARHGIGGAEDTASASICIATFRRPHGLHRLLRGVSRLRFPGDAAPRLEVIVVDNDPAGSAADICERMRPELRWSLDYHVEPSRGIPTVRNRALAEVSPGSDFVAFIDDDEVPEPDWLAELLRVQRLFDADVVAGPVIPAFEEPVPRWMEEGGFFERPRWPTGTPIRYFATNNLLVRRSRLRALDPVFDPRLALHGGSDTRLAVQLRRGGASMVWADGAEVVEWHPPSRTSTSWLLRRAFRLGATLSLVERDLDPTLRVRAVRLSKGVGRLALGTALLLPTAALGRAARVRTLQHLCRGAGMLAGLYGVGYPEYRTVHGV